MPLLPGAARAAVLVVAGLALGLCPPAVAGAVPSAPVLATGPDDPAPEPTTLVADVAAAAFSGTRRSLVARLLDADGAPVAGAAVAWDRRGAQGWDEVATVPTDDDGRAVVRVRLDRRPGRNVVRATWAGDETHAAAATGTATMPLLRRSGVVRVEGPDHVVDERQVRLRVSWRSGAGQAVPGRVRVLRRLGGGSWRPVARVVTDAEGRASLLARPRRVSRWRAVAPDLAWVRGGTSPVHAVDNRPPGPPVRLPAGAPRPRVRVPVQAHAAGAGPNAVVTRVPDRVWSQMTGRTWHRGCPVGRSALRYLRVNYWDYAGYRRRGEMVLNADVVRSAGAAFSELYTRRIPLRSMYRVDRFGWSSRVRGADDHRSMAAGNTSGFNCRDVVNRPGIRSPHSWGRAVDVNTWENPYRSATGLVPNAWWQPRTHPRVAWRSRSHTVVEVMTRHGFVWTYGTDDSQHFDARPPGVRPMRVPDCGHVVCE